MEFVEKILVVYVNWVLLQILKIIIPQYLLLEVSHIEFYQTFLTLIHSLCPICISSSGVPVDETSKCILLWAQTYLIPCPITNFKMGGGINNVHLWPSNISMIRPVAENLTSQTNLEKFSHKGFQKYCSNGLENDVKTQMDRGTDRQILLPNKVLDAFAKLIKKSMSL